MLQRFFPIFCKLAKLFDTSIKRPKTVCHIGRFGALAKNGVGLDSQKCRYVGEMSNSVINYPMLCSAVF